MPKVKIIDKIKIFEAASGRKVTPKDLGTDKPIIVGISKPIAGNLTNK